MMPGPTRTTSEWLAGKMGVVMVFMGWLLSCCDVGFGHLCRIDHPVKLLFRDETEIKGRRFQGEVIIHRVVRFEDLSYPITGASAVTSISERSTYSLIFLRFGFVPSTVLKLGDCQLRLEVEALRAEGLQRIVPGA